MEILQLLFLFETHCRQLQKHSNRNNYVKKSHKKGGRKDEEILHRSHFHMHVRDLTDILSMRYIGFAYLIINTCIYKSSF